MLVSPPVGEPEYCQCSIFDLTMKIIYLISLNNKINNFILETFLAPFITWFLCWGTEVEQGALADSEFEISTGLF
jgi:hypothetical protein